ncbi:MAG TPA: NUDIX domain-containing protein [Parafilimonas sp.]|nr:NUDIX domain-containing protein [Parafilimonas sp.]
MKKKIIAAGGLVFNDDDELLMIFRRNKWDLPKGKLDGDESIEQCALREVKEETGLKNLQLEKFINITLHEYFDQFSNEEVVKETHWFKMLASNNQDLIPQYDEGIEQIEWVNEKDLAIKLRNSYANIIEIITILKQQKA